MATDIGEIWMRMEPTGARASDPLSPFYQVDAGMCWFHPLAKFSIDLSNAVSSALSSYLV